MSLSRVIFCCLLLTPAPAAAQAACGAQPFRFVLQDVKGRLYKSAAELAREPVVLVYYTGYKSADVHDPLREALKADPVVGKGSALDKQWAGVAIVDYKEGWFVPAWAIDKALREKMAKYPNAVFLADRGECLTRDGTSSKCPGRERTPYFKSNVGYLAVLYQGYIVRKIGGPMDAGRFVAMMRKVLELAARGAPFCEVKQAAQ